MIRLGCDKKTRTRLRVRPTKGTKKVQLKQTRKMSWMLRLNFLIYSAGWAATSGYIVDTCDYCDHHQMQCGDVCMNSGQSCICGEDRIKPHNSYY